MIRFKILFFSLLLIVSAQGFAQVNKPYRPAYLQAMYIDSSRYYGQELDSTPFIGSNNIVQLYTGEHLFLDATIAKNQITTLKSLEVDSLYKPALSIELLQQANGVIHQSVTLTITNNLKKDITVLVSAFEVGKPDWTEDKLLELKKGKTTTLVWTEPMVSVLLSEWKLK